MKPHTEILYVSSSSSNGLFKEVFDKSIIKPYPTMLKFHEI